MVDDHKSSPTEGKDIMVPVTVIEVPAMRVAAIRVYTRDSYGRHPFTEAWAPGTDPALSRRITLPKNPDNAEGMTAIEAAIAQGLVTEVFAIVHTIPGIVSGIPKKVAELMEVRIGGGSIAERFAFAKDLLGKEIDIASVIQPGQYADITAITKGKGTQGPIKRWGVKLRKRKHSRGGKERHIGTLGPWHPHHIRWQIPQLGQMGYQQRTEFNKRILKIGTNAEEINPSGGFLHYGQVRNTFLIVKGSIPGPAKRLIRIRPAVRIGEHRIRTPSIGYVSTQSKQGA
jgi:large subunit ribosomal protein L3